MNTTEDAVELIAEIGKESPLILVKMILWWQLIQWITPLTLHTTEWSLETSMHTTLIHPYTPDCLLCFFKSLHQVGRVQHLFDPAVYYIGCGLLSMMGSSQMQTFVKSGLPGCSHLTTGYLSTLPS